MSSWRTASTARAVPGGLRRSTVGPVGGACSVVDTPGRPAARLPSPDGTDRHAEPGEVARCQDVAGHDLAGGVDVVEHRTVLPGYPRVGTDRDAHVGEGDSRAQRGAEER